MWSVSLGLFCFVGKGGLMTISPPAKVKNEPYQVLAYGIDSLYLSLDVHWESEALFEYLESLKEQAKEVGESAPGDITGHKDGQRWRFCVHEYGANGYGWKLESKDMTMLVGGWAKPKSRPSILVEFRSEFLWKYGPEWCVDFVTGLISKNGGKHIVVKPSRLDLCVDLLVPEEEWSMDLFEYRVTHARKGGIHFDGKTMSGMSIGRGKFSARIYDKALEIKQKSKKYWMYDVWKIDAVPKGMRVIRVEFQLRREAIKEFGAQLIEDLFEKVEEVWAYLTQKWLKFRTRPGLHHTQRKTRDFWTAVQNGFAGSQAAEPAVRRKIYAGTREQLVNQVEGGLAAINALDLEEIGASDDYEASLYESFNSVWRGKNMNVDQGRYSEKVKLKRAQMKRIEAETYKQKERQNGAA